MIIKLAFVLALVGFFAWKIRGQKTQPTKFLRDFRKELDQ